MSEVLLYMHPTPHPYLTRSPSSTASPSSTSHSLWHMGDRGGRDEAISSITGRNLVCASGSGYGLWDLGLGVPG
jgi:hypothetical protein